MEYLGLVLSEGRVEMNPIKIAGVRDWLMLKNVTEVQSLGFTTGMVNTVVFWSWFSQLWLWCPISQHRAYRVPSPVNKGISQVLL